MPEAYLKFSENSYLTIDLENGGALSKLVLDDLDIIKYPLKENDFQKGYPSALLFPFPNRVKDGTYNFEGTDYQLGINEKELNNAIHGLVAFQPFKIVEHIENKSITIAYQYNGENEGYPFPYTIHVTYKLSKGKLVMTISATNDGDKTMPCGFGWHPYFGFQGEVIGDMKIKIPGRNNIELSDRNIPTGEKTPERAGVLSLKNTFLDNLYEFRKPKTKEEIELRWKSKKLVVSQVTGNNKLNHFILYTPPGRDCIAIEPQSASTNALNNKEGLISLKPGKTCSFQIEVRIEN